MREIGIRMALGASTREGTRLVASYTLPMLVVGVATGTLIGVMSSRLLGSYLLGLGALRPAPAAAAAAVLCLAGLAAAIGPARRAARVDPADILREE